MFATFHWSTMFITAFKTASHWPVSWARYTWFRPPSRLILTSSCHLRLCLPSVLFSTDLRLKFCTHCHLLHECYTPYPYYAPWFDNLTWAVIASFINSIKDITWTPSEKGKKKKIHKICLCIYYTLGNNYLKYESAIGLGPPGQARTAMLEPFRRPPLQSVLI